MFGRSVGIIAAVAALGSGAAVYRGLYPSQNMAPVPAATPAPSTSTSQSESGIVESKPIQPREVAVVERGDAIASPNAATDAAKILALPYDSVRLIEARDTFTTANITVKPEKGLDMTGNNATVVIRTAVTPTVEVRAALQQSKDSDNLAIERAKITGYLLDTNPAAENPNFIRVPDNDHKNGLTPDKQGNIKARVFPSNEWEAANGSDEEPGRQMVVYIENTAHALDGAGNDVDVTGQTPVAAFELHTVEGGAQWQPIQLPEQVVASIETRTVA